MSSMQEHETKRSAVNGNPVKLEHEDMKTASCEVKSITAIRKHEADNKREQVE
jgi:hypothetical protein